jgi:small subunit ribosomal protein S16
MAVVIRMKRAGAKKRPFYRVVVANSRSPRDGRYIEQLGYYDPLTNPATFKVDAAKVALWISRGALPSESVGVMVAKHAPEALQAHTRPVPPVQGAAGMTPADLAPEPKKPKAPRAKAAAKPQAKAKRVKRAKAATKGSEKKARTRAKAKARKASGVAEPRAKKKAKKSKS